MSDKEKQILMLLKIYRIYNNFIPKFIKKKLNKVLEFMRVPPHTIGVFFNQNTSPMEQLDIILYFKRRNDKKLGDILKIMVS
jgi:hypothetical protein